MKMHHFSLLVLINTLFGISVSAQTTQAQNPIIWADVPDMSVIRVDDTWYMSSTTMHMTPGVPSVMGKTTMEEGPGQAVCVIITALTMFQPSPTLPGKLMFIQQTILKEDPGKHRPSLLLCMIIPSSLMTMVVYI
jgi:hypothetical protein